jgi:capsular exopolysaccharide synthesis family protein
MESGPRPPYPAELLGSKKAAELIDEWRTMYDYIVIDTPPVLLLTDAVILGRYADALLLVVRYSRTTKQALRASLRILDGAHIPCTGIVINATNTSASEYTSYYGYGYAEYGAYASVSESEDGGGNEK